VSPAGATGSKMLRFHSTTILAVRHRDKAVMERSAVELAKDWRTDRILRRLEAMLVVLDKASTFLLSGNGDLIEPDDGIVAIGSGGPYALAAAKALANNTDLDARAIAEKAMAIAGEICIYTNAKLVIEEL
jgi:ATP-dependent HslUV protease subunit HslV